MQTSQIKWGGWDGLVVSFLTCRLCDPGLNPTGGFGIFSPYLENSRGGRGPPTSKTDSSFFVFSPWGFATRAILVENRSLDSP